MPSGGSICWWGSIKKCWGGFGGPDVDGGGAEEAERGLARGSPLERGRGGGRGGLARGSLVRVSSEEANASRGDVEEAEREEEEVEVEEGR